MNKNNKILNPVKKLSGTINVSGDKSISHRSAIFAALADGTTVIKGFLQAEDCMNTLNSLKSLGVDIKLEDSGNIIIKGKGLYGLEEPQEKLYFGNSGTGMRLMAGVLAAQKFDSILTGDESLSTRPMKRISEPLNSMGAKISIADGHPPISITSSDLQGITYNSPVASAQVKSCILLAALYAKGRTVVTEPFRSRDHTEKLMNYLGIPLTIDNNTISIDNMITGYKAKDITVPGDPSSAAFFLAAAALVQNSDLRIKKINMNPTRRGFIEVLKRMGASIKISNESLLCNEKLADVSLEYSGILNAIEISESEMPGVIDEVPLLALLATQAKGDTIINGISELRKKESDRVLSVTSQLSLMGQVLIDEGDRLIIRGRSSVLRASNKLSSFGDHRIAMMLSVAALAADGETEISDISCVDTSFPEFYKILETTIAG